jgi:hypothetical protein
MALGRCSYDWTGSGLDHSIRNKIVWTWSWISSFPLTNCGVDNLVQGTSGPELQGYAWVDNPRGGGYRGLTYPSGLIGRAFADGGLVVIMGEHSR